MKKNLKKRKLNSGSYDYINTNLDLVGQDFIINKYHNFIQILNRKNNRVTGIQVEISTTAGLK